MKQIKESNRKDVSEKETSRESKNKIPTCKKEIRSETKNTIPTCKEETKKRMPGAGVLVWRWTPSKSHPAATPATAGLKTPALKDNGAAEQ